ncbi:hypothetical protein GCM10009735_16020 [Actinomadura chokoriensis]
MQGGRGGTVAAHTSLIAAVGASALVFAPGYDEPAPVLALLGCAAALSVAVAAGLTARLSTAGALLCGLLVPLVCVTAVAAWRPGPVPGVIPGAADALLHSGARILTTTSPAPTTVDTLTLPLLATWLAGAASASALRGARPLTALLPPVGLLTGAVVLAGPTDRPGYGAVAVLAASAAVLLGTVAPAGSGGARLRLPGNRAVMRTLASAAALAALVALAGPPIMADWSRRPPDPRSAARPPTASQEAVNPLSYLPAWGRWPNERLLRVRADRPVELRWVTLAEFTGQTWLPEAAYRPAGARLPAPKPVPRRATAHTASITVGDMPGPWLPTAGYPRSVQGLAVAYDPNSGTLVTRGGQSAGCRYTVSGEVPDWRSADLADALVPTDPAFEIYRELTTEPPARIRDLAVLVAGRGAPYHKAARLAEYLRNHYVLDVRARGGHGYANLASFLVAPGGGRRGAGTADQFASAFAVLARVAGLPSRVVVGFEEGRPDGSGHRWIHTGDAVAWGEIYFKDVGWVPFDVIPGRQTTTGSRAAPEGALPSARPSSRPSPRPSTGQPTAPGVSGHGTRGGDGGTRLWAPILMVAGMGILVSPVLVVPLLRWRRTRRRLRRGAAAERILGAWAEALDALRLAGRPVPAAYTARDIAARYPELEWLAGQVNAAGFGPRPAAGPGDAAAATDLTRAYSRTLRTSQPPLRRLLWWLDPRPLFW